MRLRPRDGDVICRGTETGMPTLSTLSRTGRSTALPVRRSCKDRCPPCPVLRSWQFCLGKTQAVVLSVLSTNRGHQQQRGNDETTPAS